MTLVSLAAAAAAIDGHGGVRGLASWAGRRRPASRKILLPGSRCCPAWLERFGADIIKEDGTPDRRSLADRAFATPGRGKAALDALTHLEIVRRIRWRCQTGRAAGGGEAFVLDGAVTPSERPFFSFTALLSLAIRQDCCEKLPCLQAKILVHPAHSGHENSFIYQRPAGFGLSVLLHWLRFSRRRDGYRRRSWRLSFRRNGASGYKGSLSGSARRRNALPSAADCLPSPIRCGRRRQR